MKRTTSIVLACIALTGHVEVRAEIDINGFATIAGGKTSSDEREVYAYDDKFNFTENSLAGLQITSDLSEGLSATVQILSRGSQEWETKFEWAYLSYQLNDNIKFNIGRQRVPYFVYSDFLDVGYAYHWIAPPEETYTIPYASTDGVSMMLTNSFGGVHSTLQVLYGRNKETLTTSGTAARSDSMDQASVNWTLNRDWLTFRIGYARSDLILDIQQVNQLAAAWTAANFSNFVPYISASDDDNSGDFLGAGVTIDYNNILFVTEYTEINLEGTAFFESDQSYYMSMGYRFGTIMPHITYGTRESTPSDYSFLDTVPTGVGLDELIAGTTALFESSRADIDYWTVGLRWDFHPAAAFKLEGTSRDDNLISESETLFRLALTTVF